ncbi:MAG TPA: hypothetical protein VNK26_02785 [Pyrinomonadaceae bacterium]|nr:hypothetical protein [Pyrinomonadaceae bacterium]
MNPENSGKDPVNDLNVAVAFLVDEMRHDGWQISNVSTENAPHIIAGKNGEIAAVTVSVARIPERGKFNGDMEEYKRLVRSAKAIGADCYFAPIGIAPALRNPSDDFAPYDVLFDGLIKMELPDE